MCSRHRPENGADSLPFDEPPDDDAEPWNDELAVWENDDDAQAS